MKNNKILDKKIMEDKMIIGIENLKEKQKEKEESE